MLQKKSKFAILMPVYNERHTIGTMIDGLYSSRYDYLIVNDGSTDGTIDFLHCYYANWIGYMGNKGKGYAIKYGAKELFRKGYEYVLVMDSDGQNSFDDIPQFAIALTIYPNAKIIIGNRLHKPTGMPFIRLLTNKFISWLISILSGQKIFDSQCGFRLLHKDVFDLGLKEGGFALESEMLIKAGKRGYKVKNVPIKCIYAKNRVSKIRPVRDFVQFIKMLWRIYNV